MEHFEDDDDDDNDSDDVEDVSIHGSWITNRYSGGDIKVRDVPICSAFLCRPVRVSGRFSFRPEKEDGNEDAYDGDPYQD